MRFSTQKRPDPVISPVDFSTERPENLPIGATSLVNRDQTHPNHHRHALSQQDSRPRTSHPSRLSPWTDHRPPPASVPVIGYVLFGAFIFQIEGQPERRCTAGEAIYEPANTTIARFDNESPTQPAAVIACYLAGPDDHDLIRFLPPSRGKRCSAELSTPQQQENCSRSFSLLVYVLCLCFQVRRGFSLGILGQQRGGL